VKAPRLEQRRTAQFSAELRERARSWIPSWAVADGERDFGRALLEVAARFSSEVAERLDSVGEKLQRGFLDFLAVRGDAARPARMPVVFKLAGTAREPVLASAPVRMQVDAGGTPVVFETEKDVRLLPGRLEVVVGVDADQDAFYLQPPGLNDLGPVEPLPSQWQLKSFAAAGATRLQVDPEAGLVVGLIADAAGQQYRLTKVEKEIVTIDPPLTADLPAQSVLRKVTAFAPFDGAARNRQEHALYLGQSELLDIESKATIEVTGAVSLRDGVTWQYWGKVDGNDEVAWQRLTPIAAQHGNGVFLAKEKGKVELFEVAGRKSRWIRAMTPTVPAGPPLRFDELALRINSEACTDEDAFPGTPPPAAEGMANTTPLVLDNVFYPLGREPRQFDAFYLGCPEAFSKPGAEVQLHFDLADPSFESLAALRPTTSVNQLLAGVAGDGHLYLLQFNSGTLTIDKRGPLRPPSPDENGKAVVAPPIPLQGRPSYRAPMWKVASELFVAAAADTPGMVWMFHDAGDKSGWKSLGEVGPVADPAQKITSLVHLDQGTSGCLFALREKTLFVFDLDNPNAGWKAMTTTDVDTTGAVALETIVPIVIEDATGLSLGPGTVTTGLAGADAGKLYVLTLNLGANPFATCKGRIDHVTPTVAPAAVLRSNQELHLAALSDDFTKLKAWRSLATPPTDEVTLGTMKPIGHSIDVDVISGLLQFALCVQDAPHSTALALWSPFLLPLLVTPIPASLGTAGGAPTLLPQYVLVPTTTSQVLIGELDFTGLLARQTKIKTAVIATTAADQLDVGANIAIPTIDQGTTKYDLQTVPVPFMLGTEALYEFDGFPADDTLFVFPTTGGQSFSVTPDPLLDKFTPAGTDNFTPSLTSATQLLIQTDTSIKLYEAQFDPISGKVLVVPNLDAASQANPITYQLPTISQARIAPLLHLDSTNGDWKASLLARTFLTFPTATPERLHGIAFTFDPPGDPNGNPVLVVLEELWTTPPQLDFNGKANFLIDGRIRQWTPQLGDPTANPSLSWEYANGTGWWKLDLIKEETQNLKQTGNVRFIVPDDLRPMDWAGRTSYWIRARLIGGDFGKEIITIKQSPPSNGETTQTIERSTAGIRAPSVTKLVIAYRLCKPLRPAFVLARDNGSIRDQSDANRTRGAVVEAFVPLAVALGRLSSAAPPPETTEEQCPPPCACPGAHAATTSAASTTATAGAAERLATGRALFIGLAATPSGAPVHVLLLVDKESPNEAFAPMNIDALIADHFVPVVAEDTTRALGESGLLSMSFALPPTPRELFGNENLTWLRLTPRITHAAGDWKPNLRGAYLNAVYASAAETLTRELLGSSQGEPNLTVFLARPPVLHDTLELRVREPLGDEERASLRENAANAVLSDVNGLDGDWVLWRRVTDPGDEKETARVYALDETNGEVRFGDGQHGMIPPIGLDSIVAFSYRRTEPGNTPGASVPGNTIGPRTALNLVSPVQTVEAVFAADQAAGGAPPESDERVVRFGTARLRHRRRAVTAQDFEDLALESSPDIVQARCFAGRGGVRLVVVMRGKEPRPNAAAVRELRSLLLAAAPASLAAPDALRVAGPRLRRLRVVLALRVATLDQAGEVSSAAEGRIKALFDTTTWALGAQPREEDIALALLDTRHLEGIAGVELREVAGGEERRWSGTVKRDELVLLDDDPLRIDFETVEVIS
jgi:hypothetical protein